jgi:hypothetical protein
MEVDMDRQIARIPIQSLLHIPAGCGPQEGRQFSFLIGHADGQMAVNIVSDDGPLVAIFAVLPCELQIAIVKQLVAALSKARDSTVVLEDQVSGKCALVTRLSEDERNVRLCITH